MSSLIFFTTKDDIILAMDTLAVSSDDGDPLLFTTKFYVVPHLQSVICGTGDGALVCDWFVHVNTRMVISDILNLDYHTPAGLRSLATTPRPDRTFAGGTSTIYQFGFPEEDGPPCAFAYRSAHDFRSEALPIGRVAVKPECDVPEHPCFPQDFEMMMRSQRVNESAKARGERVYIGGDIEVCHVTREQTCIYRVASFEDREDTLRKMLQKIDDERRQG